LEKPSYRKRRDVSRSTMRDKLGGLAAALLAVAGAAPT
jgi:hypothetical protein